MNETVVTGSVLNKNSEIEFGERLNWFLCNLVVPAVEIVRSYRKCLLTIFGDTRSEIHASGIWLSSASLTKHQLCFDQG